jgi:hypothetical protein
MRSYTIGNSAHRKITFILIHYDVSLEEFKDEQMPELPEIQLE